MKPIRMCIVCKKRNYQEDLIRMQCKNGKITQFKGSGRSFYVCFECINSTKTLKLLAKRCNTTKDDIKAMLEEFSLSILH
jgi:predicted RNA-binding protein YlxR (DUF448 family)